MDWNFDAGRVLKKSRSLDAGLRSEIIDACVQIPGLVDSLLCFIIQMPGPGFGKQPTYGPFLGASGQTRPSPHPYQSLRIRRSTFPQWRRSPNLGLSIQDPWKRSGRVTLKLFLALWFLGLLMSGNLDAANDRELTLHAETERVLLGTYLDI